MSALYPWLAPAWALLGQRIQARNLPHGLLFTGPEGLGKQHLAEYLAQALLCQQRDTAQQPCQRCQDCLWFGAHTHPDISHIQVAEDKNQISVEQIRGLMHFISLKGSRSNTRVALIHVADQLNSAAANALLKTLEEPPPGAHLLLISAHPTRLAATLRSRCQLIKVALPPASAALSWLQTQDVALSKALLESALVLAHGAPLKALQLAQQHQDHDKTWSEEIAQLLRLTNNEQSPMELARHWQSKAPGDVIQRLYLLTADIIRHKLMLTPAYLAQAERAGSLQSLANRLDLDKTFYFQDQLLEGQRASSTALNVHMLFEDLLIRFNACRTS